MLREEITEPRRN